MCLILGNLQDDVQLQREQNFKVFIIFELIQMSIPIFDPFPGPQERGQIKNCEICQKQFGVFLRQHQCKRCYRAVCADCGTTKRNVYKQQFKMKPHRLCNVCKVQQDYIIDFIKQNKLKFGQTSQIGNKWSKKVQKQVNLQKQSKTSNNKTDSKLTKQMFNQLWDSYNPSLRQFIGLLTFDYSQDDIYISAEKVFSQVISCSTINLTTDKIDNIMYIVMFILCFANIQKSVKLTIYLLQIKKTFNQNLPLLVGQSKRGTNLQRTSNLSMSLGKEIICEYLKALGMTEIQVKKCNQFIGRILKKFMNNFSINNTITEGSIYVIGRILQRKKYEQLYFYLSLLIQTNKDLIININKSNNNNIDIMILQRSNLQTITQKYKKVSSIKGILNNQLSQVKYEKTISDLSDFSMDSQVKSNNSHSSMGSNYSNHAKKQYPTLQKERQEQNKKYNFKKKQLELEDSSQDNVSVVKTTAMLSQLSSHKKIHHIEVKNSDRLRYSGDKSNQIQRQPRKTIDLGKKECQNCKMSKLQVSQLTKQIQNLKLKLSEKQKEIIKINSLKEPMIFDSQNQNQKNSQDNFQYIQKIKYLEQKLFEFQNQNYSLSKDLQKSQIQITAFKSRIEELITTNKMLKNSVQNNYLQQNSYQQNNQHSNTNQIAQLKQTNQLLKQSLLQKNEQMESLHKKNKILTYQIQQKSSSQTKTKDLQQKIKKLQSQNLAMLKKIQELSLMIIQQEQMALDQADQNFLLKQILRDNKIKFQGYQIVETNQHRRTTRDMSFQIEQTRKSISNNSVSRSDSQGKDLFKKMV